MKASGYAPILQVPETMVKEPKTHVQEELKPPVDAICCVCICTVGGIVCMVMSCFLVQKWNSLDGGARVGVSVMFFYGLVTCIAILLGIYGLLIALCAGPPARKPVRRAPLANSA